MALLVLALALCGPVGAQPAASHAVILVTLDGVRHQELFGGVDLDVLRAQVEAGQAIEAHPLYQRFWAPTPDERRQKLLPFLWGTLVRQHGSVAGNPARGSRVHLSNRHWFSYPGYAEMLLGRAHDELIRSNDAVHSPYPTILEFLRSRAGLTVHQVAAFASWSVFNQICERTPGTLTINAGPEPWSSPDPVVQRLSALQFETRTPWADVRHDAYTFRFAMDHLARHRPRVVYLAFDETDDWAHDGRYDRYLEAIVQTDRYLEELWTWLQAQPEYRDRTSLLITTDHGRGTGPTAWRDHGDDVPGAGETWMVFVSPAMARRGEWSAHAPLTTAQVAATLAAWLGLDWKEFNPQAAPPVEPR